MTEGDEVTGTWNDPATERQFATLVEVFELFERAAITSWLSGGWAVDFHAGRITRSHSDIDFLIGLDLNRIARTLLRKASFVELPTTSPTQGLVKIEKGDVEVEITLVAARGGKMVTPGFEHWPWPAGTFGDQWAELGGHRVRVVSVRSLIDTKSQWAVRIGDPPRLHDLADLALLRSLT
jgi:hypothetical protein